MRSTIPPADPVPTKRGALARAGRVLAAEARLCLGPPRPESVPRTPDLLTAEWLTAVLCRGVPRAEVTSVTRPRAASWGTTTRAALQVAYNQAGTGAGLPRHLFVKCTSSVPQRLMLGMGGLISGEAGFYEHIRPQLEIEAPAGYFGTVDAQSWRSIVVMEDVSVTRGACFRTAEPLSRAQMEDLLASVARWHGALWESPSLATTWNWLRTPAEQARLIEALIGMADRTGAGARRAAAALPPNLRDRQAELFEGMRRSLTWLGEPPHTYLHGDLHLGNTYATPDGRMGVCDWQVGLRGGWAHDVSYLLITGLDVRDRRSWERDLLALYLEQLTQSGGVAPSEPDAWLAYRRATLYPYFAWIYTLGRSRLQPRFQAPEMALTLIGRIAAAIEDLDSLGAAGL
ncbi:MAG TPA: phosphotransferase [Solirubrobacteraceae bacterium]|nr:phosphotransferase [Solirubrobacteraceae bacterium]